MKEQINNAHIWNAAARTGLVFGLFSGICLAAKQLAAASGMPASTSTILGIALWGLEFFGCIALMAFFMKKLSRDFDEVTRRDTFRYGRRIALLSGLILAAVQLLLVTTVGRETFETTMEEAMQAYTPMLDANASNALEEMLDMLPVFAFFGQWLWCWIYGTILSSILSRFIPAEEW